VAVEAALALAPTLAFGSQSRRAAFPAMPHQLYLLELLFLLLLLPLLLLGGLLLLLPLGSVCSLGLLEVRSRS